MNVAEAIKMRRSVRGFKETPVDDALIRKIFAEAQQAPSNCNSQVWRVSVVSGDARKRLEDELVKLVVAQAKPAPAFARFEQDILPIHKERQIDCAIQLYKAAGVTREDKMGRQMLMLKNWQFFGAPHVAFLSMPAQLHEIHAVDMGIYLQTLMLLFVENGLASCPQGALAYFPEPIFEIAKIPEGHGILCGISFGYEDDASALNGFDLGRAPLGDSVDFIA